MKKRQRMLNVACFCTMNHSTIGMILRQRQDHGIRKSVVYRTGQDYGTCKSMYLMMSTITSKMHGKCWKRLGNCLVCGVS